MENAAAWVRLPYGVRALRGCTESTVVACDHTGHGAKRTFFDAGRNTGVMAAVVSGHYGAGAAEGSRPLRGWCRCGVGCHSTSPAKGRCPSFA